jgi:iron complex outermembrane receptor protein
MTNGTESFRKRLMVAGASALALAVLPGSLARADSSAAQVNLGLAQAVPATQSESVVVRAQRRLLREKNSPSAVTELGQKQIAATGVAGSAATLLRQAPSVFVYQQGLGDNAPELTIRGLRGLEIATTLDGVPTQDLLAPGAFYLSNNIGGVFTLSQISGVSIYPGVAYPDKSTFGTIGGTIAYDTKRPTNDFYLDVSGGVGSFGTYTEGFEVNSGAIDSPLGTGDNAAKVLLNYRNLQTQGFIDGTPNRENEMEAAFDKPYNDGLSKFQATVLYNTGDGLIENEPVPVPYLNKNGMFSNYPTNLVSAREDNDYLTVILKNDTYVNDYLNLGVTAFYLHNDNALTTYGDPRVFAPNGGTGILTVDGASPFINNPAGFGLSNGFYGPGGPFYNRVYPYNPASTAIPGSANCPTSVINKFGGYANSPCGINSELNVGQSDTYGIQPRASIIVPEVYGIANTINIGGLFAKETSPLSQNYLGVTQNVPQTPENLSGYLPQGYDGGTQRTIFQAYAQDKIDLFGDTLHLTPGGTVEGTASSFHGSEVFDGETGAFVNYKANKWDREYLPFFNVSYDFDKVLPAAKGLTAYGSIGNSALFAPVTDFGPNTAGPPPYASIVHLYEGGLKYNTSNLLLSVDYFYQKVDRDFGFFQFQSGPQNGAAEYTGYGQREFKGEEGAATYQLTPNWQVFGNFSHLSAKYLTSGFAFDTVAEDQFGTEFKGNPVSGVPDWLANFGVDYAKKSTFLDDDAVNVRFAGTYTGHQYTTYDESGTAYLTSPNFAALAPLNYAYGSCNPVPKNATLAQKIESSCAYTRYNQVTGATVTNTNGGGISPFAIFNLDANYVLPTPYLPVVKKLTFDLNVQNLFNQHYFQYYYSQISPGNCGTIKTGKLAGAAANNYSCSGQFQDGIPGQPFSVFFTVTARF